MNKFDQIVWRINGLIILGVSIIGGLLALYAAYMIFEETTSQRHRYGIVNVDEQTEKKERLFLGSFERVHGQPYFISPLYADQQYDRSYYSKSTSAIRNYLFYAEQEANGHWLFDQHHYLIQNKYELDESVDVDQEKGSTDIKPTTGFVFVTIKEDTDNDKILDADDNKSIIVTDHKGGKSQVVLESVTEVIDLIQNSAESFIVFYTEKNKSKALEFNYTTGKILKTSELPL